MATDNPCQIMQNPVNRNGKPKPGEKEEVSKKWRSPYNPMDPIETMFENLKELWIQALISGPAYTENKPIDWALNNTKQTGLYLAAVID